MMKSNLKLDSMSSYIKKNTNKSFREHDLNINDISAIHVHKNSKNHHNHATSTFDSMTSDSPSVDLNSTIKEELASSRHSSLRKSPHKINFTPTHLDDTYID